MIHKTLRIKLTDGVIPQVNVSAAKRAGELLAPANRPENSFTHSEYVKANGVSRTSATAAINKLREIGRVRSVKFNVQRSDGKWQLVTGWQLVEPSKTIDTKAKKR